MKKTLKNTTAFLLVAIMLLIPFTPFAQAAATFEVLQAASLASNIKMIELDKGHVTNFAAYTKTYTTDEYVPLNEKALEITASCETVYDKAQAINKWVAENVYYDYDYYYHGEARPSDRDTDVFETQIAVCAGYANLMVYLCRAAGVPARKVQGYSFNDPVDLEEYAAAVETPSYNSITHEWVEFYANDQWNVADPTWDSRNKYEYGEKKSGNYKEKYFAASIESFSERHHIIRYVDFWYDDFRFLVIPTSCTIEKYAGTEKNVVIPDLGMPTDIYNAFSGNKTMESVVVPNTITSLRGFYYCTALKSVDCSACKNLTEIGKSCFIECTSLEEIILPTTVTTITRSAFEKCSSLKTLDCGDNLESIGNYAFRDCTSLQTLYLPSTLKEIGDYALYNCGELKFIYFSGTQAQWDQIDLGNNAKYLENVAIITSDHKHSLSSTVTKAATCSETGTETLTCTVCNYTTTKTIGKTSHTPVTVAAVEATCTKTGLTAGKKCSVCGETIVTQTVVQTKDHDYKLTAQSAPSCTENGSKTYTCTGCGGTKTEVVAKTGHSDPNDDGSCDSCGAPISSENCSCICHKSGISAFFYKIARLFWKLFGTRKMCDCGAAHY